LFSKPLLEIVKQQLGNIGSIREGTKKELVYTVTGLNQIVDLLIPFIDKHHVFSPLLAASQLFPPLCSLCS
jgi:hypothetical protein